MSAQRFLSIHAAMYNAFNDQRHSYFSQDTRILQGIGYGDMARGRRSGVSSDAPRNSLHASLSNVMVLTSNKAGHR